MGALAGIGSSAADRLGIDSAKTSPAPMDCRSNGSGCRAGSWAACGVVTSPLSRVKSAASSGPLLRRLCFPGFRSGTGPGPDCHPSRGGRSSGAVGHIRRRWPEFECEFGYGGLIEPREAVEPETGRCARLVSLSGLRAGSACLQIHQSWSFCQAVRVAARQWRVRSSRVLLWLGCRPGRVPECFPRWWVRPRGRV